jgi:hypothetical protein
MLCVLIILNKLYKNILNISLNSILQFELRPKYSRLDTYEVDAEIIGKENHAS